MFWKAVAAGLFFLFLGLARAEATEVPPQQPKQSQPSRNAPAPASSETADAYARKRDLMLKLEKHAEWYSKDAGRQRKIYLSLTFSVMIGSALTALLVAMDFASKGDAAKALVVALPLLTGLFTTILGQFNVRDVWKLREMGRIDALALRDRVRALPTAATDVEMRTALLPFEQEKSELERQQALAFFEYLARHEEKENPAGEEAKE
jgi:hypothetical protein